MREFSLGAPTGPRSFLPWAGHCKMGGGRPTSPYDSPPGSPRGLQGLASNKSLAGQEAKKSPLSSVAQAQGSSSLAPRPPPLKAAPLALLPAPPSTTAGPTGGSAAPRPMWLSTGWGASVQKDSSGLEQDGGVKSETDPCAIHRPGSHARTAAQTPRAAAAGRAGQAWF